MENKRLTLALQKSGRLSEGSIELLRKCGIKVTNGGNHLKAAAEGFPLDILLLRDDDIPQYVADGVADIGMLGLNEVLEKKKDIEVVKPLGFSKCRLSMAIPREDIYGGRAWLAGKKIATSYPAILEDFLAKNGLTAEIHTLTGSVEIAPGIGMPRVERIYPSKANFLLVKTASAAKIYQTLISNGIVVRDRSSQPGCGNCLRVTVGNADENSALVNAWSNIKNSEL